MLNRSIEAEFESIVADYDQLPKLDGADATRDFAEEILARHATQVLREREQRFRELLDALPAAIYTTDALGRITFFNQAAIEFAGRTPRIGEMWCVTWKLYHLDGTPLPHDECPMAVALKENRPVRNAEAVAERPDGSRIIFTPYPTPLRDENGRLVGAVNMLVDITLRKQWEERLKLLAREVDHRANNLLAVVQATIHLTHAETADEFKRALNGRIRAIARAHSLLSADRWIGVDLRRLFEDELAPYLFSASRQIRMDGADVVLDSTLAQSLSVIIHELTTNAAKYGALSRPTGELTVEWRRESGDRLTIVWEERGGPPVELPTRHGFGSKAIEGMLRHQLCGDISLDWRREGLCGVLTVPLGGAMRQ